ncbi:MAG: membrane protein insertion efficiency factor YidD [Deltaproteobacteria bacterium]|nr:membrane protein insertion efficiency factor YidD [Deltaproteobacteria bacterium]
MKTFIKTLLYLYKSAVSPFLPPSCRFYPSCSDYAKEAVHIHGAFYGGYLAGRRLLRCQPLHSGGYDPVPLTFHAKTIKDNE